MKGNYYVTYEIDDDIFICRHFEEDELDYIYGKLNQFDWKSLQRLPQQNEMISFLGVISFEITVKDVWIWQVADDGQYDMEPGLHYVIFIGDIEITQDNRKSTTHE